MSDRPGGRDTTIAHLVEQYLVCPETHDPLRVQDTTIACPKCSFKGTLLDNVAVMMEGDHASFFDDKFEIMRQGIIEKGADWRMAVERQAALLESYFTAGQVILDVGCGPHLPYQPRDDAFLIGLEPSLPSIRANHHVSLGVCGTATNIPLPDHSVDLAVAFYSIHHMVGTKVRENDQIVERAFLELARVMKAGGRLFVVEMTPWRLFAALQRLFWNPGRRVLGGKLDMYFRSASSMAAFGRAAFPHAALETIDFKCSLLETFPPIFSLPWLRLPKLLYPLESRAYIWRF
jgi:SAM-dependent methyltransferase